MNKIFKSIWNYRTQSYTAVSECQKKRGKTAKSITTLVGAIALSMLCSRPVFAVQWAASATVNLWKDRDGGTPNVKLGYFGFGNSVAAKEYLVGKGLKTLI